MKKLYLTVAIIALVTCAAGVFTLASGIAERGFGGVNYGRVVFPLIISAVFFRLFRKQKQA